MNRRIKKVLSAILIIMLLLSDCSGIINKIAYATDVTGNNIEEANKETNKPSLNLDISLDSFMNLVNLGKKIMKLKVKLDYENVTEIKEGYTEVNIPKILEEVPSVVKVNEIYGANKEARTLSRR